MNLGPEMVGILHGEEQLTATWGGQRELQADCLRVCFFGVPSPEQTET
jgi:hypothetical protein